MGISKNKMILLTTTVFVLIMIAFVYVLGIFGVTATVPGMVLVIKMSLFFYVGAIIGVSYK